MAIFEAAPAGRLSLDDTLPIRCTIENAHNDDGHTEYIIKCRRGFESSSSDRDSWTVSRRYSEFAALNSNFHSKTETPFPKKKLIGNMNPDFVAERRNELQLYLETILKNNLLSSSLPFKMFIDPKNYSSTMHEIALQNVSMALRGEGRFQLKSPLPKIGWRIRKYYYIVSKTGDADEKYMMTWQTYGPDKVLSERDFKSTIKCLASLEHSFIDKSAQIQNLESGSYVIQSIHPNGSVKDHIYAVEYKNAYANKYSNPRQRKAFTVGQIAHYGYQILHALKFLHEKGWPYGHLHTGNIAIEKQKIVLLDIVNSILGLPSKLRHFLLKHKKICSLQSVDVYSFGHVLYEMAYGEELSESTCEVFPNNGSSELTNVLMSILTPTSCKNGMPSVDYLLSHPFFNTSSSVYMDMEKEIHGSIKLSTSVKENLKKIMEATETRLKNDQKLYVMEKKQVRIQEILSSEEEIQRRKRKVKRKENDLYRSKSLNGISSSSNMCSPDKRSESVNSSLSTTSSHHSNTDLNNVNSKTHNLASTNTERNVLLDSICSFNKKELRRVNNT